VRSTLPLILALGFAAAGCGSEPGSGDSAGPPASADLPDPTSRGARLLAENGCLACHALGGQGEDGPGPALDGLGASRSREQLRAALVDSPGSMPSYEGMPEADLEALLDYLAARR
jgi:mono/diheme cytochrome c family protein